MFTQGLARELGSLGVTVNNVEPGPIDTDLNPASGEWAVSQKALVPLGRYGRPEEIAAFLPETPKGQRGCRISDVFVDDRGYIFAADRARGGIYVLEYTGDVPLT